MQVVIAGGSGLLGTALSRALIADGHAVSVLTRGPDREATAGSTRRIHWDPANAGGAWTDAVGNADGIVNLAGESIAARWTSTHKRKILESRTSATTSLVNAIAQARTTPPVFISGSAVGYYGPRGSELLTEDSPTGGDFLASVCKAWEAAAAPAMARTRVVLLRTGLVLSREGGALPKMLPPFRIGAGGPVGSGQQYWPWIHVRDWVDGARYALSNVSVEGPVNLTAPEPVTNAAFATALGHAMHRPAFMPAPGFALKLLLGEMAEALLLSGQRAIPDKIRRLGFTFRFDTLEAALADLFR